MCFEIVGGSMGLGVWCMDIVWRMKKCVFGWRLVRCNVLLLVVVLLKWMVFGGFFSVGWLVV